jgi:hypothetical protein
MFNRVPRNEKWETIRRREMVKDTVFVILAAPFAYAFVVMVMSL